MVDAGNCVMGHLGLTPQNLSPMGGYRISHDLLGNTAMQMRALSGAGRPPSDRARE